MLSDLAYAELFRQQSAALGAAGAGRDRYRRRVHLDVEDLFDAGLAHRLCGRQRAHHRGARAGEIYLDYGAFTPVQVAATAALNGPDDCIHEMRATYKRRRDVLVESLRPRRLARAGAARLHVRLGADPRAVPSLGSVEFSTLLVEKGRGRGLSRHRLRRARRGLCAHRAWSRTSSASARPPATSAAFLKAAPKSCVVPPGPTALTRRLPQVDDVRWLRR